MRKGMALGTGQGYKNIVGRDPAVHSQSAKGMKQPQQIPHLENIFHKTNPMGASTTKGNPSYSDLKDKHIVIKANRWFDKKYGNTYHSTEVFIDGKLIGREPFEYGYDEQYINTAFKILQKHGIIPTTKERLSSGMDKDFYDFTQFKRDNRDNVLTLVSDVGNKRDL